MMVSARIQPRRRADALQFQLIYLATLPAFLVGTLVARLVPPRLLPARRPAGRPGTSSRLSVFGEAKAAARTCGSFALMG